MNPENTNQQAGINPTPGAQTPLSPAPGEKGLGKVIALVVIILVLLAGGYFLMQNGDENVFPVDTVAPIVEETTVGGTLEASAVDPNTVQGTSIDLTDIEKDLNATDLDALSADLNAI